jgi:hypothetical protein
MTNSAQKLDARPEKKVKRICILLTILSCMLVLSYTHDIPFDNAASRYATIDSLAHHQSFNIAKSPFAKFTVDKIFTKDGQLSTKPPLLSTLVALVYKGYTKITGRTLHSHPHQSLYLLNLLVGLGSTLFLLFYAYRVMILWTKDLSLRVAGFTILALGYLGFSYATTLNNHTPAAAALFAAFFYIYRKRLGDKSSRCHMAFAGLLMGLATAFDHGAGLLSLGFVGYMFLLDRQQCITVVMPAALLPLLANSCLNYYATGTWLPIQIQPELYATAQNYWNSPQQHLIDAIEPPKWRYTLHFLIGHHGIFSFNPVFLFALPTLFLSLKKSSQDFNEALVVSMSLCGMLAYYILRTHNYGGICIGARWFILIMPMLVLFALRFVEKYPKPHIRRLFWLSIAISVYNSVQGMKSPWQLSAWYDYFAACSWS